VFGVKQVLELIVHDLRFSLFLVLRLFLFLLLGLTFVVRFLLFSYQVRVALFRLLAVPLGLQVLGLFSIFVLKLFA